MALASTEDFEARHGPADDFVEPLLDDASALILDLVESSEEEWVTTYEDEDATAPPAAIVAVCVEVAYRAWSNPDALSREALGAHSQSWRATAAEALYLTKREQRVIRKAGRGSRMVSATLETPYSGDVADELTTPPLD